MNSTTLTLSPEKLIFAENNEVKTTSLNIAEAFGKLHKHVIRDIEKVIERVREIDNAPKFGLCFKNNELQNGKPLPFYEMDKDGFMLVVMGYTGEKAMTVKVAYINAFNWMFNQLFGNSEQLPTTPEPLTKLAYQGGLALSDQDIIKTAVKQRAESLPKEKWAGATIKMWSTIKAKYGCTYKMIAQDQTAAILSLIARMDFDDETLEIPKKELESFFQERIAAFPPPVQADQSNNSISIGLNFPEGMRQITLRFETEGFSHGRWFTALSDGRIMIEKLNDNAMPLTFEQWIEYAIKERGYVVLPKHQVLAKLAA